MAKIDPKQKIIHNLLLAIFPGTTVKLNGRLIRIKIPMVDENFSVTRVAKELTKLTGSKFEHSKARLKAKGPAGSYFGVTFNGSIAKEVRSVEDIVEKMRVGGLVINLQGDSEDEDDFQDSGEIIWYLTHVEGKRRSKDEVYAGEIEELKKHPAIREVILVIDKRIDSYLVHKEDGYSLLNEVQVDFVNRPNTKFGNHELPDC